MRNIIIVGFMGTGKTVVSKKLAKKMNKAYVSTDDLVEKREGRAIKDIFEGDGEEYFRKMEKAVIDIVCDESDQVVDTGGGAILDPENFKAFKKNGIVICLWADPDTILSRTQKHTGRPLLNVEDPKTSIQKLLEYRKSFYEKADFHVDTTEGDVDVIVDRIMKIVNLESGIYPDSVETGPGSTLWEFLLAKLLQNADATIMITDNNGEVVYVNERFREYFNPEGEGLSGRNWIDIIIPEQARAGAREQFEKMKETGTSLRFKMTVVDKRKREESFYWVVSPLSRKLGFFMMFIGRPSDYPHRQFVDIDPVTNREILDAIFSGSRENEPATAKHSMRVMLFAVSLAKKVGMDQEDIEALKIAALLHDIGKLAVDERILFKKGSLDDKEFEEMKKHPGLSAEMIKSVSFLSPILPIVVSHHENFDGSGYPRGVGGEDIPLEARILSIADMYEALTTDRPYRKAFSREEAIEIMEDSKGWKLDPKLTDVFLEMVRGDKLEEDVT